MQLKRRKLSWTRAAVVVWVSVWMLAVPLFHVHPEADHRHGEIGHVHGGTVHTVWSQDLECEFDGHPQIDRTDKPAQGGVGNLAQFSHPGDNHMEFGLSLLSDSTDRKSLKPCVAQVLGSSPAVLSDGECPVRLQRDPAVVLPSTPYGHAIVPRGPPSLLV